jgi:hypothetical protein
MNFLVRPESKCDPIKDIGNCLLEMIASQNLEKECQKFIELTQSGKSSFEDLLMHEFITKKEKEEMSPMQQIIVDEEM